MKVFAVTIALLATARLVAAAPSKNGFGQYVESATHS